MTITAGTAQFSTTGRAAPAPKPYDPRYDPLLAAVENCAVPAVIVMAFPRSGTTSPRAGSAASCGTRS